MSTSGSSASARRFRSLWPRQLLLACFVAFACVSLASAETGPLAVVDLKSQEAGELARSPLLQTSLLEPSAMGEPEVAVALSGVLQSRVTAADGNEYSQLVIPSCGVSAEEIGQPAVPFQGMFLEIPHGVNVSVEVTGKAEVSLGTGFRIYPLQPLEPDIAGAPKPEFWIDRDVYNTDAFVPASPVVIEQVGFVRGRRVAFLKVFPLRYNPVTTELRAFESLRFALRFEGEADTSGELRKSRLASVESEALAGQIILNYEPIAGGSDEVEPELSGGDAADYLIIVADALYAEVLPFANWKHRKGFRTRLVPMSDVGSSDTDVESYIQNAYDTWSPAPAYVLLVGDQADIPGYDIVGHPYHGDTHHWPSDHLYACVDGIDDFPDLMIGRLSVHTPAEAAVVVGKILAYERTPDMGDWYDDFLAAAYLQDSDDDNGTADRWFMETAMTAYKFMTMDGDGPGWDGHTALCTTYWPLHYGTWHFRSGNYSHRSTLNGIRWGVSPYPDPVPTWIVDLWTSDTDARQAITDAVNAGVGLIQHRDHGGYTGWGDPPFYVSNVNALSNAAKTPVVLSMNCLTGGFDYGSDCFAEAWQKHSNGGAAGIIAATRVSYSGPNDLLTHGLYDCFYPQYDTSYGGTTYSNSMRPAEALAYGKYYMYSYYAHILTLRLFHWFGDPEMPIRTQTPQSIAVSHPSAIVYNRPEDVTVNVAQGGARLKNALVCISHPNAEDHWTGTTGANGSVTLSGVTVTQLDDYDIVVSEPNSIPYEGVISVASVTVRAVDANAEPGGTDTVDVILEGTPNPSPTPNVGGCLATLAFDGGVLVQPSDIDVSLGPALAGGSLVVNTTVPGEVVVSLLKIPGAAITSGMVLFSVDFAVEDPPSSDSSLLSITSLDLVNDTGSSLGAIAGPDGVFTVDRPPVLDPIGDRQVDEGQVLNFVVTASDPNGTIPMLSASPLPGDATFVDNGNGTGTFNWVTDYDDAGQYPVEFVASDGSLIDTEQITITVNDVPRPPVLDPIGDRQVDETQTLNFVVTASDPDGTIPMLSASPLPDDATFVDNGNGTGTFNWVTDYDDAGQYPVEFVASDGSLTDTEQITITVNDVPRPPAALLIQNADEQTVAELDSNGNLTLAGSLTENSTPGATLDSDFLVKNSDENVVAAVDSAGNMVLAGSAYENQGPLSPPAGSFIVKNDQGDVVAYISSDGDLYLTGQVSTGS